VTHAGRYYTLDNAALLPPPERRIPILVGAHGPRMMRLTARWADAWNTAWFADADGVVRERVAEFEAALAEQDRPPGDVERSIGLPDDDYPAPDLAARLAAFEELGFGHAIVLLDPPTADSVARLAEAARLSRG
jgi:alkanesulfonate monooxygenase SsuD/methylene tetrahydromethanopterin reductase-like flavin-dependent oxidoreductase (luciferase family)